MHYGRGLRRSAYPRVADLHVLPEDEGRGAADPPGGMDRTILVVVGRMEVIVMSASANSNMRKYQSFMLRV